ncbi:MULTISPECIES: acyl carrier protein [unclassified Frankia]
MNGSWDDTFDRLVRSALAEYPPEAPLELGTPLPAHGMDSMAMVGLAAALETSYGFSFPAPALVPATFATAGTLWDAVRAARR